MTPYPGKKGRAEYCQFGNHFYEVAIKKGDKYHCKDCGHVLGERRRKTSKEKTVERAA